MSDTASQTAPPAKTLQQEIDFQTSTSGGRMVTFVIEGKEGGCKLPNFTSARLKNCKIDALVVPESSILYLDGCTVIYNASNSYTVKNSAVMAFNTTFAAPITFLNSKIELRSACTINQTFTLTDTSQLKSVNSVWKAGTQNNTVAIIAKKGSRVESYRDKWEGWLDCFWNASGNSIIKVINSTEITNNSTSGKHGLGILDTNSVLVLSHPLTNIAISAVGVPSTSLFIGTNHSRFELYNFGSLTSDNGLFDLTDSRVVVRNVSTLLSKKMGIAKLVKSFIDFSNVSSIQSNSTNAFPLFDLTNSTLTFSNTATGATLKTNGPVFKLNQSNINFVSNSFDYSSDSNTGPTILSNGDKAIDAINSKLFVKNVKSLSSSTNQALSLVGSSFYGTNITSITGGSNGDAITGTTSYLSLVNVKNIKSSGDNGINLSNCKGSLLNVARIDSTGSQGAGLALTSSSYVVCRNMGPITGPDNGVFVDTLSCLIFKGKGTTITGKNTSGLKVGFGCRVNMSDIAKIEASVKTGSSGVYIAGEKARVELKDIANITGNAGTGYGILSTGGDLTIDNSGVLVDPATGVGAVITGNTGVSLKSGSSYPLGTYKATFIGPTKVHGVTALEADNYQVYEQGITWDGDVILASSSLDSIVSKINGAIINTQSYSKYLNMVASGDLNLSNLSSFNMIRSTISGNTTIDQSVLDMSLSILSKAGLSNYGGLIADSSEVGDVKLADSFLKTFGSKTGEVTFDGKSSAFGGASRSATLTPNPDDPYTNPVAYFIASGGDMAFQADDTVWLEANDLNFKLRDTNTQTSANLTTIESTQNNVLITAPLGYVDYEADTQIVFTCGASTITLNPASISINSTVVNIN